MFGACCLILQLAGPTGTLTQSDTVNNQYNNNTDLSNSYNNNSSSGSKSVRIQPGGRFPSQTAPARLGMWDDDHDEDKFLKVLLLAHRGRRSFRRRTPLTA